MLTKTATASFLLLVTSIAHCEQPNALPSVKSKLVMRNGLTQVQANSVSTKSIDNQHVITLSGKSKLEHSGQSNGSFTLSANTIRFSIPHDAITNPGVGSPDELDATGSCSFDAGAFRITAHKIAMRTDPKAGQSTITFSGNVMISANGLTATAESVSLARSGNTWQLSGSLADPGNGG